MNLGCYPVRPWDEFYLTDSGYLSEKYHESYKKWHRGEDINGRGGGDTDLGVTVQSMFPGQVLFAEAPESSSWGGIVLIRTEDWLKKQIEQKLNISLNVLDIQYAHLQHITVEKGMFINAGEHIGSIGKGGYNSYLAHLHLEARREDLSAAAPQGGDEAALELVKRYCIDPKLLLANLPLSDFSELIPSGRKRIFGRGYWKDQKEEGSEVVVNRIGDKVYLRVNSYGMIE